MSELSGTEIVRLVKRQTHTRILLFSAEACGVDGCTRKGQDVSRVLE